MTDTTTGTTTEAALTEAREHAEKSWQMFTGQTGYAAKVPDWRTGTCPDGALSLSGQVVGPGAVNALQRFARDYHLVLSRDGDQRPQFDIDVPGRTVLVWRYSGVWVELWHPDPAAPAVQGPPAPSSGPAARRAFLRRPSGRLPFTRKARTTNPKETNAR